MIATDYYGLPPDFHGLPPDCHGFPPDFHGLKFFEIEIEIIYLPKKGRRPLQIARANQGGGHQKKK